MASNPPLTYLDLTDNQLDDNDAMAIASALKHNTNLLILNLNLNNLTRDGWLALRKAVYDDTSLNSVSDSNHNCCIDFPLYGHGSYLYRDVREMNGSAPGSDYVYDEVYVRQKKIYYTMSSWNRSCSNVEHLEDVPFELLPDILVSIQVYSDYHLPDNAPRQSADDAYPLSIVYEICRNFDECLAVYETVGSYSTNTRGTNETECGVSNENSQKHG